MLLIQQLCTRRIHLTPAIFVSCRCTEIISSSIIGGSQRNMSTADYDKSFGSYKLSSHEPLIALKRSKCKKCKSSRMYFCYKCHSYVSGLDESKMPKIKLPWKIDIIKHPKEVDGKSTAIHAALLAPDHVKIYTYPTIPTYSKYDKILLVFPNKKASTMEEVFDSGIVEPGKKRSNDGDACDVKTKCSKSENGAGLDDKSSESIPIHSKLAKFDKIIFIDCTWGQAYGIATDERIKNIPTVKLGDQNTVYWRHNDEMPFTYLATIEAIYSFLKVSHELVYGDYDNRYDDLLYFYSYFYKLVQNGMQNKGKPQNHHKVTET